VTLSALLTVMPNSVSFFRTAKLSLYETYSFPIHTNRNTNILICPLLLKISPVSNLHLFDKDLIIGVFVYPRYFNSKQHEETDIGRLGLVLI
jgi:hypothetical protein